jgi:hypothetical protein
MTPPWASAVGCRLLDGQPSLGDDLAPGVEDAGLTLQHSAATQRAYRTPARTPAVRDAAGSRPSLPAAARQTQLLPQALRQQ